MNNKGFWGAIGTFLMSNTGFFLIIILLASIGIIPGARDLMKGVGSLGSAAGKIGDLIGKTTDGIEWLVTYPFNPVRKALNGETDYEITNMQKTTINCKKYIAAGNNKLPFYNWCNTNKQKSLFIYTNAIDWKVYTNAEKYALSNSGKINFQYHGTDMFKISAEYAPKLKTSWFVFGDRDQDFSIIFKGFKDSTQIGTIRHNVINGHFNVANAANTSTTNNSNIQIIVNDDSSNPVFQVIIFPPLDGGKKKKEISFDNKTIFEYEIGVPIMIITNKDASASTTNKISTLISSIKNKIKNAWTGTITKTKNSNVITPQNGKTTTLLFQINNAYHGIEHNIHLLKKQGNTDSYISIKKALEEKLIKAVPDSFYLEGTQFTSNGNKVVGLLFLTFNNTIAGDYAIEIDPGVFLEGKYLGAYHSGKTIKFTVNTNNPVMPGNANVTEEITLNPRQVVLMNNVNSSTASFLLDKLSVYKSNKTFNLFGQNIPEWGATVPLKYEGNKIILMYLEPSDKINISLNLENTNIPNNIALNGKYHNDEESAFLNKLANWISNINSEWGRKVSNAIAKKYYSIENIDIENSFEKVN